MQQANIALAVTSDRCLSQDIALAGISGRLSHDTNGQFRTGADRMHSRVGAGSSLQVALGGGKRPFELER